MKRFKTAHFRILGMFVLIAGLTFTSCNDSSTSALEDEEVTIAAQKAENNTANLTTGSNVLFEDDFESNSLSDYSIGHFGQSVGSASISNGEFLVNGNFVKSFSPNVNFNGTQVATDGGFSICMDVSPLAARPGGTSNSVRISVSLGHENTSDAVEGFDGNANDGYFRLRGFLGEAIIGGSTVIYDEDPAFGKSYKMTVTVDTDEISAGTPYTATLYMDGEEIGVFSGEWDSENNYLGFHAIDGNWSFDNLVINSSSSSPCLPTTTNKVFISDENVLTYDHINAPTISDWTTSVCKDDGSGSIGLDDPRWFRVDGQKASNIRPLLNNGLHAFEHPFFNSIHHPNNFGEAEWINSVNKRYSLEMNDDSDEGGKGHNWTRYELPVDGKGTFELKLLADNCSWIYLDDKLVGYQDDSGLEDVNNIRYGVTLDGPATLSYIIYDGGGDAGGKFRLETTTEVVDPYVPPTPVNNAPSADAGADQTVPALGQTTSVALDGSGSSDPDGDTLSYLWTFNGDKVANTKTAEIYLEKGSYTLTLTVSDGELSHSDQINVTVLNSIPVADAGEAQTHEAGGPTTEVTLDGSGSSDVDGDLLTYSWTLDGEEESTDVSPKLNLGVGVHTFTLTVTDEEKETNSDDVVITITDNTSPTLTFNQVTGNLWPPNHKMVLVVTDISASDIVDGGTDVTVTVSSSEVSNGKGDGNTDKDYDIVTKSDGSQEVYVRSERSGKGKDGRTYTITMSTIDEAGNTSSKDIEVKVAQNQGRGK